MFIAELTFKNEYLFTQFVLVLCELATGQITNDGGRTGNFITHAVEHASLYARYWAGYPAEGFMVNDDPLAVVGMDVHGFPIIKDSRLKIETIAEGRAARSWPE
jgi:hypothetical protein